MPASPADLEPPRPACRRDGSRRDAGARRARLGRRGGRRPARARPAARVLGDLARPVRRAGRPADRRAPLSRLGDRSGSREPGRRRRPTTAFPLYTWFVGLVDAVAGPDPAAVKTVQAWVSGRHLCAGLGDRPRTLPAPPLLLIGAAIWALCGTSIFFDAYVLPGSLDAFLQTALVYLLLVAGRTTSLLPGALPACWWAWARCTAAACCCCCRCCSSGSPCSRAGAPRQPERRGSADPQRLGAASRCGCSRRCSRLGQSRSRPSPGRTRLMTAAGGQGKHARDRAPAR